MLESQSRVATSKPAPYMKQLCKHFGHKAEATFDDERGTIHLPMGTCQLVATEPGVLAIALTAEDVDSLARLKHVVGSHLERFGRRDELHVSWD